MGTEAVDTNAQSPPRLVVGIDLGTTNCCLAWSVDGRDVSVFPVPQLTPNGRERRALLPSVLYAPIAGEAVSEPHCPPPWLTGEHARARGQDVPGRTVTSAKSWLGHPTTTPLEEALPWGASEGAPRISAVDASARYLRHLAGAFEVETGLRVRDAEIVLTVPASFDDGARSYTVVAAKRAGLDVTLLEEPQAAFYDYMASASALDDLVQRAAGAARVLVIDVGGGTTDLSLISVTRAGGGVEIERVATGDHLLLGGDNMDLALAMTCKLHASGRAVDPQRDPARLGQLVLQCRAAKEALLSERAPDSFPITIVGRGSRLVGSTSSARITRAEVERVVLDGFFPPVRAGDAGPPRSALVTVGLPYERDPAITRHIARFLERYGDGTPPSAVLFNGGVFRARAIRRAVASAIAGWSGRDLCILQESHPDLAVARGAVRYGIARSTGGRRVTAGAARSYYVGVGPRQAVCVIPRGTREGARCVASTAPFQLLTGQPARFDLYRAATGVQHAVGALVDVGGRDFARLPPLVTEVAGDGGSIDVELAGELTPVGTLELSLRERRGKRRAFSLAFSVRHAEPVPPPAPAEPVGASKSALASATALIAAAFAFEGKDGKRVKELVRELERTLGDRFSWTMQDARILLDALLPHRGARRWSGDHERVFWMLAGFCLRPGFGAPDDAARLRTLLELFAPRLTFPDRPASWQAYFIAWRRVSAGLDEASQTAIHDALAPLVGDRGRAPDELDELLSWLERVGPRRKIALGTRLLAEALEPRAPGLKSGRIMRALGRIGARTVVYGEPEHVLPATAVEPWLVELLRLDWGLPALHTLNSAIVSLARVTGAPHRDIDRKLGRALVKKLEASGATDGEKRAITEHVPLSMAEQRQRFGDALPVGLTLGGARR